MTPPAWPEAGYRRDIFDKTKKEIKKSRNPDFVFGAVFYTVICF